MPTWLLLLHQIPPKPPYFRAKVLRRLAQVGALPIKNSAYLLPDSDDTREDFEWIRKEIDAEGGAAWLFRADALAGLSKEQIESSFRRLRDNDYRELIASARELDEAKLVQRYEQLKRIDFFANPAREELEAIIEERQRMVQGDERSASSPGQTWVTRKGIKVDRIGSAWLIRRFIDPQAIFRFVDAEGYLHSPPEIRFDMYDGEFTHEGELCTFEVLAARHQLLQQHPGLQPIAEMIHDIDLKDNRFARPETLGLSRMLDGICSRLSDDEVRLREGSLLFDSLLRSFES